MNSFKTEVRFLTGKFRGLESCITVVSKNLMRQNIRYIFSFGSIEVLDLKGIFNRLKKGIK